MPMSRKIAEEVLPRLRQRYVGRGREGRTRLIDEVCEQWDYSRKHVIKLLGGKAGWGGELGSRKGRPPLYGEAEGAVLWKVWKAAEQPCGKRLKALLPDWLPHYEVEHGKLDSKLREKLLSISTAQGANRAPWPLRHQARGVAQNPDTDPHGQLGHHPARIPGSRHGGALWR